MSENKLFVPIAIIVAGLIVAGAIFFSGDSDTTDLGEITLDEDNPAEEIVVAPITDQDHILGNPDAEVVIVEYSDFECPFCARFHPTMSQLMDEYGQSGDLAWVYRHFPLQIHPDARPAAMASECVAELGGNEAFWAYSGLLFDGQAEGSLTTDGLRQNAVTLGIDETAFNTCVEEERYAEKVDQMYDDGLVIAQADPNFGTPYSIAIKKDGTQLVIPGAQPYNIVKQVIDSLLAE